MEEILASIRKIISEDEEDAPKQEEDPAPEVEVAVEGPERGHESEEEMALEEEVEPELIDDDDDDEVLELIEEVEEDDELELLEDDNDELQPEPTLETAAMVVSGPTAQAGADAFGQLAGIIAGRMQLGQGRTVEELVQELLRPLLREWLDENLPELVDELVKKEIERMVEKANR